MCRLCGTRPFSRLSVTDIAREAGIGRSGFYYHFTDRNAAIQWLSRRAFAHGIDEIGRTLSWFDGHYATTCTLVRFKPLIAAAAEDDSYTGAELSYLRHRKANLLGTLRLRGIEASELLAFEIEATAAMEQHMTSAYLCGNLGKMHPRRFCQMLASSVPNELRQAIELSGA